MKIFDAHFHIIDFDYPIVENNGYIPREFKVEDYKNSTKDYELAGGAIVSGSFQAFDQNYLKNSLSQLGGNFFGVANIPINMSDKELKLLNDNNVVAVRFNLKRGGSETIEHLEYLSNKLYEEYGWHTELYVDSKHLKELKKHLRKLKQFSIDHLGLSKSGLVELYNWVEKGVKVKATGFGRIDFEPTGVMRKINEINPEALIFGTDLPSTRAKTPFSNLDIQKIVNNFDKNSQERIFYKNALAWYKK
ncbi:amidohydrolase family protein [Aquimarina gracilis]|uniref:Amidohydrolase family protein n=1 Tax=Aquimarina gracilis TaxID=874422 RepID=A0ABU5ZRT2_9FLAO|nr:amidohydrolase family protein [Aquimarina gracilis]MEB3344743.1 amidohydrolase family protein [Aquimarina gracilis]